VASLAMLVSVATACSSCSSDPAARPGVTADGGVGNTRIALTCNRMIDNFRSLGNLVLKPGDWGNAPAELHALPAGAEACGGGVPDQVSFHQIWISSEVQGQALADFYAPISTTMGCTQTLNSNQLGALTSWSLTIKCAGGKQILIGTDATYQMYSINIL